MTENHDRESKVSPSVSEGDVSSASQTGRPERRGPPPNPLDHPLFLPVLLVAFCLWFGWDGFLATDPEMAKHQTFNQIMFFIMLPFCLWLVPSGIKSFRSDNAANNAADNKTPTDDSTH
jgi:hypothetical protein